MALPITITYTFATATGSIPLSQLDTNFSTLASAVNGIGDGTNYIIVATNATTNTTPALTFNASNCLWSAGVATSGSYNQVVIQNESASAGASVNYVLSNNLGTDSTYYGEFGMNSSAYTATTYVDFFSMNNGVYFSSHDGDVTVGSGNGFKTYLAWGTTGQSAHVINASGAIGLNTNLGTSAATTGTTNYGTAGQVLVSAGSAATATWSSTPTLTVTNFTGTASININGTVGATTPSTGAFTTFSATSNVVTSVSAATSGLTAVTAVAGSLTLATGGVTLASQTAAAGSVWRVRAYGTYAAASSANVRALTMSCYWGTTQLTAITTGNVLAAVAQTTAWSVEFEVSTTSTTAAWNTGVLSSQVSSATIPLNSVATPASVTVTSGAQTLDFRVGQTGTATATDTINVHQVLMERIK
ncbi:hypothetical protein UFOVP263_45 [uncultured Caudovirales phage]|uniref:Uncharacterized protein n=1 Tax=uncultured Caudovirales phage TaxID=2100421 RepID=A0A6J5TDE3_9CAUD|nr:hypothetical protein UFOVP263_45 [uncultured Caudovirales phage]CAB4242015.1 hypothetical protein UFOVP91_17 [uncultured Caudovirales phage]